MACAACLCFLSPTAALAQTKTYRPPARYVQIGKPDQAEGARILRDFRTRNTIAGDYFLRFELHVLPRRGEERVVSGRFWGGRNAAGPVSRVVLAPGDLQAERRLFVQSGLQGAVWTWQPGQAAAPTQVAVPQLFDRLADTDLSAFDLQMPFLYWNDFVFEGVTPMQGRPAHVFLLYPPPQVAELRPELTGVRIYLDTQYNALVKAEQIGRGEEVLKSVTSGDLKKVDDQWIVKWFDVRDAITRNKTRFVITGVALGLDFPGTLFTPQMLPDAVEAPGPDHLRGITQ